MKLADVIAEIVKDVTTKNESMQSLGKEFRIRGKRFYEVKDIVVTKREVIIKITGDNK